MATVLKTQLAILFYHPELHSVHIFTFFFCILHGIDKISFPFSTTFPLNRPPTRKYKMMGGDKHMCMEDGVSRSNMKEL